MTRASNSTPLKPEFAFLLRATRWPHDEEAVRHIRKAAVAVNDPGLLLALTRRHHVTGLVAQAVSHCETFVGTPLRDALRQDAMNLAGEQLRQLVQTRDAVEALRTRGIGVVVLKGVPAALTIYGHAGVRQSVDIDLLIEPDDLELAQGVLETIGYARSVPPRNATARQLGAVARYGKDWGFDHHHSDTGIELHWRLFQNPRLLGHVGVADAVECTVAPGLSLPVLRPGIAALYLVAHGAEHAWSRLKWVADLATVLRREPEAADRVIASAIAQGIPNLTMAALLLAHELYATPLPATGYPTIAREWRTRRLLDIARVCLLGEQDASELEDQPNATTRKSLGHYLFSADPRYWWREMAYDLFHDADTGAGRRIARRITHVLRPARLRARRQPLRHMP